MITNERQYRITRSEAEKFRRVLDEMTATGAVREGVHPRLVQAEREALESQLEDLRAEITEYEQLKNTNLSVISISSFEDLAEGLIKARIAAGLSQRALAERLKLKEQQIQRYEAERYASASFQRLRDISDAIGVRIRNDILLPVAPNNFDGLISKLKQVGLDSDFLLTRLLPSQDAAMASKEVHAEDDQAFVAKAGAVLSRVFGWSRDNIFGAEPLAVPRFAAAEARFKMPAGKKQSVTSLYAAYANYLAVVVLKACQALETKPIDVDPLAMRQAIMMAGNGFNLTSALHYAWDIGIPVLPLHDPGTFHGACWRYEGRNVVILKQNSKHEARWIFDLVHELFHVAQNPELDTIEVIEADETSVERRNAEEEIAASQFAGDVALNGRAEELAQMCVELAQGSVKNLKRVVPQVCTSEGVDVGSLANYLAFRLSWQGINWWGTASNLQDGGQDPWEIARDVFLERFPFNIESDTDRKLLERALH